MHLTYSRRAVMKFTLLLAVAGLGGLALAIWPTRRLDHDVLRIFMVGCGLLCLFAAILSAKMWSRGPVLSAEADGLRVNVGPKERRLAWRDVESIERAVRSYSYPKPVPVPVIEILLRGSPEAAPIHVPVGMIEQGEAGVDRWIGEARRRLGIAALA